MDLIIISIISTLIITILALIFRINLKKVKQIGMEEELNKLSEKYPSNTEICKDILKKLGNEEVKIEEDKVQTPDAGRPFQPP